MNKKAVILINTGTPNSPSRSDVKSYLKEFLGDKRVINLPFVARKILVNGIIVPFRASKSSGLYSKVWTEKGSPLLWHSQNLQSKLQNLLGEQYDVHLGMRYGKPSLFDVLKQLEHQRLDEIILIPLFPQYASSTTGSALASAFEQIKGWEVIPSVKVVGQFFDHPAFLNSITEKINTHNPGNFDHVLFSYHSLPVSHVSATHGNRDCIHYNCSKELNEHNVYCYHATCYATTRLLAGKLGLTTDNYTVCFQSRFSKNWIGPFTDQVVMEKAKNGVKSILVISPSFVTDCLETIVEIDNDYRNLFLINGGELLERVESLNDSDSWVNALATIIE